MRLEELIKPLGDSKLVQGLSDFQVKGIACNSAKVSDGYIFVAIKGTHLDGNKFIDEAIERGAKALIIQASSPKPQAPKGVAIIEVKDSRRALAKLAVEFYGNPSQKIKVIGITGTNGKTTITYLLEAILKKTGFNPAVIGTINYRFQDKILPSVNTTPGPLEIQSMLSRMLKQNVNYAIMEVSSHALAQNRTDGVDFHSAIFTNLSQDHLDYHKTLGAYFLAKARLFKNIKDESFAVINNDDAYAAKLKKIAASKRIITYGLKNSSDITAEDIKLDIRYTEFILKKHKSRIGFKTKLIGNHNLYNILASIAWADAQGLDFKAVKAALEDFDFVPGRLQRIESKAKFSIFVDYAHTEDALQNVLVALRKVSRRKIIVVFGCGGDRDKTKRPKMGHVVTELADYAVITNDNPRSEEPRKIIEDIKTGIKKDNYIVIPDRKDAIARALSLAQADDVVLIAGKGHEDYQVLKDKTIHFDDRQVTEECLKSMNY